MQRVSDSHASSSFVPACVVLVEFLEGGYRFNILRPPEDRIVALLLSD